MTGMILPVRPAEEPNGQDPAAWVPDTRVIPPELNDEYEAAPYEPVRFLKWQDQIDHATIATLSEWARGGIGEPDA